MGVLDLFLDLAALPSPPGEERDGRRPRHSASCAASGSSVDEDGAGEGSARRGQPVRRLEPTAEGTPLFLCAHMDTVPPTARSSRSSRTASSGTAAARSSAPTTRLRSRRWSRRRPAWSSRAGPHAGIELLFTPKEEVGLRGAQAFDCSRLAARVGYVYDQAGRSAKSILGAPNSMAWRSPSRPVRPRRHGAGGGALCDRGRRPRDRGHETRTSRRGDLGERRRHHGRRRPQHRPRPLRPELPRRGPTTSGSSRTSYRRCSTPARSPPPWPDARSRPR